MFYTSNSGFCGKHKEDLCERILRDGVNHPPHYQSKNGIEVIEVIEDFDLSFSLGNCIKYILRHREKGRPLEDLRKAKWYLDREIENFYKK